MARPRMTEKVREELATLITLAESWLEADACETLSNEEVDEINAALRWAAAAGLHNWTGKHSKEGGHDWDGEADVQ